MADQATVTSGNGRAASPAEAARNVAGLAHDMASLAELQAKLLAVDIKDGVSRLVLLGLLALVGAALALACFPLLLIACANALVLGGLPYWAAFLLSAGGGAIVSGILIALAWFRLRRSFDVVQRSREELARNLRWIKNSLQSGRQSWRTRKRAWPYHSSNNPGELTS